MGTTKENIKEFRCMNVDEKLIITKVSIDLKKNLIERMQDFEVGF